ILKKIRTRNGNDSYYDKVRADVRSVFRKLENKIWSEAAEDQERVSIAETIENGDILSIRIPDNDKYVLDYLFNELLYQLNHGRRFLLVVDELAVGMLDRLDMLKNPSLNVELIQSVPDFGNGESDSEWENIIYRLDDIILLNFPMARAAEPVARMVGRYWGKRITENKNKHRGARDWFAGHGHGTVESQDFYERIPPEMLTEIGDAAYLFSDEIYYARVIEW
ncbi:MAG: hypothetical protein J6M27_13750, partial [Lachnospiraceae bacterium]|nr:hypothetical protein [Lachnospiraceae bacterium]